MDDPYLACQHSPLPYIGFIAKAQQMIMKRGRSEQLYNTSQLVQLLCKTNKILR